ncbi:MAG: alpha/beta hydrolase [Limisphaerales bacterium]
MSDSLQIRVHGDAALPTLIYLPGLHGDWLLVTRFRVAVAGRVRFVEFTYPNTVTWSLADYAAAVEGKLREHGIARGWLLAESFGSQVAWPLLQSQSFRAEGLILAGGFARHPWMAAVRATEWLINRAPLQWLTAIVSGYAVLARWRFKQNPEVLAALREFKERWGEPLRHAAAHRVRLIAANDPRPIARTATLPVFSLSGMLDPVVPWPPVQRRLRRECPGWRANAVVWTADHNVLGTGTEAAVKRVLHWMAGASPDAQASQLRQDSA